MKRNIWPSTAAFVSFWNANSAAVKADLFVLNLPTGQTIYATDAQFDVLWNGHSYSATQNGRFTRGDITSEVSFTPKANKVDVTFVPGYGLPYPGLSISALNAAINRLYDGTTVTIYTAWFPIGGTGTPSVVETVFTGRIDKAKKPTRLDCVFECADHFILLDQKVPTRLFQSACFKQFADSECGLSAANYTVTFTAQAGSTQRKLIPSSAFSQADGYFTQGIVTCTNGSNKGLSQMVKVHSSGQLQMVAPWLIPIAAGDTFSVIKGCDQTPTTCAGMTRANGTPESQDWRQRFGGTPFLPPPESVL